MAGDSAGFESYLRGSWWEVQIREARSPMFLVSYTADKDEDWAWVPSTELRMSSRRGDGWDCYLLKKGVYVAVLSKHPHSSSLNLEKEGLYDARVSSVTRSNHAPGECSCKFSIHFLSVNLDTYWDGSVLDRVLLMDEPEAEVSISDVRILQKPAEIIPFQDVLEAHLDRMWIPLGRGCQDAYFLTETELSTAKRPSGACLDGTGPTSVRSDEVLSPSLEAIGGQQSPGTPNAEYRIPKRASGALENQKQKQSGGSGGYADGSGPKSTNIKRKCVLAEDHDNGMVDEGASKEKPGRPKLDKSTKGKQIIEEENVCNNAKVTALNKDLKSRHKDSTKYTVKEEKVEEYLWLNKDLRSRHKEKAKFTITKEKIVDLEWTEILNVSSGSDSDSEGEWKPPVGLTRVPHKPYNIRTRDKTVCHKPESEEKNVITGDPRGIPSIGVHQKSNRAPYGKNPLDKEVKRDYR